jgi:hypothetical protein
MATIIWARHSEEASPYAYEVSCRVRMGDCIRPSRRQTDRGRPPPRGLHPKDRLTTPQMWVPRSCQADVESLECGDRTRRTASSTTPKMTKPDDHTHAAHTCHISDKQLRNKRPEFADTQAWQSGWTAHRCPVSCGPGLARTASWVTQQSSLFGSACRRAETPVFTERTSVGLAVHARSVVATAARVRYSGNGWAPGNEDVIGGEITARAVGGGLPSRSDRSVWQSWARFDGNHPEPG